MRALLLSADLGGNVPPTLAVADALARLGHEVEVAGLAPARTGGRSIPFPPAEAATGPGRESGFRGMRALARLMTGAATSEQARQLVADRRPDVVVAALLDDDALRARADATGRRLRSLRPGAEVAAERIVAAAG